MKKSDLKSGMVVSLRDWKEKFILIGDAFCSVSGKDFLTLGSYDDDLKTKSNSGKRLDIVEVYECKYPNFMSCFIENKLELIWKREEVDWSKVPFGTEVLCYDYAGDTKLKGRLLSYSKDSEIPFKVFIEASNECYIFRHCELIEEPKEEKEVTYEEVYADYDEYCKNYECTYCKYRKNGDGDCTIAYILDNYKVTRK